MTREQLATIRASFDSGQPLEFDETLALLAEVQYLQERVFVLEEAMVSIERRLRVKAAPLVDLVKAHGGLEERNAWKAVYSSAITAQIVGPIRAKETEE